jgi:hypothetical protein
LVWYAVFWFRLVCFVLVCLAWVWFALFWFDSVCLAWVGFPFLVWLVRRVAGRLGWKFLDPLSDNEIQKTDSAALTSTLTPSTLKLCFMVSERGT